MSEIDKILEAYRDMFGVKTERANEIHRDACIEVARLRTIEKAARDVLNLALGLGDDDGWYFERRNGQAYCDALAAALGGEG